MKQLFGITGFLYSKKYIYIERQGKQQKNMNCDNNNSFKYYYFKSRWGLNRKTKIYFLQFLIDGSFARKQS